MYKKSKHKRKRITIRILMENYLLPVFLTAIVYQYLLLAYLTAGYTFNSLLQMIFISAVVMYITFQILFKAFQGFVRWLVKHHILKKRSWLMDIVSQLFYWKYSRLYFSWKQKYSWYNCGDIFEYYIFIYIFCFHE